VIKTNILIIGQGIAGTSLAVELERSGNHDFLILDNEYHASSSMAAAGTINPVTGRQYVKSWLYEDLKIVFEDTYSHLNHSEQVTFLKNLPIIRSLHSIKEENMWLARMEDAQYVNYLDFHTNLDKISSWIKPPQSFGEIKAAFQLQLRTLLPHLKKKWLVEKKYIDDKFEYGQLKISKNEIQYKDIVANKIVFCEGHQVVNNPYFNHLPFDPVKGEALIIHLPDGFDISVRDKIFITPLGDDLYWCGANYAWKYTDHLPSKEGFDFVKSNLDQILVQPYEITDHWAGIRPATKSRRPIVEQHEQFKNLYLFNGLGTKGSSLAPYFAKKMVHELLLLE
jgi:glycine oxidase